MKSCVRCHASTPTGLRFCNYCGSPLDQGVNEEDLVFGSLALKPSPKEEAPYKAPSHLRALPPVATQDPVSVARNVARQLPGKAMNFAGVAGRAAAQVAGRVAQAVRRNTGKSEPQVPKLTVVPQAASPAAPQETPKEQPVARELQLAYQLYQKGKAAYDAGNRSVAAQYFAQALKVSPPDSPLGQFLRKVLKVRKAPVAAPAVRPELAHPSEGQGLTRTHGAASFAPASVPAPTVAPTPLVVPPARNKAVKEATVTGIARNKNTTSESRRRRAREYAQSQWLRALPGHGPSRPSAVLDQASENHQMEWIAGGAMVASAFGFLMLLLF